jgi:hypothetical protein
MMPNNTLPTGSAPVAFSNYKTISIAALFYPQLLLKHGIIHKILFGMIEAAFASIQFNVVKTQTKAFCKFACPLNENR